MKQIFTFFSKLPFPDFVSSFRFRLSISGRPFPFLSVASVSGCPFKLKIIEVSISPIFYKQLFIRNFFSAAFMCLQFGFVIFWQKDFGAKACP
jgi:hypothetical protein